MSSRLPINPVWVVQETDFYLAVPMVTCYEFVAFRGSLLVVKQRGSTRNIHPARGRHWFTDQQELLTWFAANCKHGAETAGNKLRAFTEAIEKGPTVEYVPAEKPSAKIRLN